METPGIPSHAPRDTSLEETNIFTSYLTSQRMGGMPNVNSPIGMTTGRRLFGAFGEGPKTFQN